MTDAEHTHPTQQLSANYDGTVAQMQGGQDSIGWQWYSTAQVPSFPHPSYTTVSNPPLATDVYPLYWPKQELDRTFINSRQGHNAVPALLHTPQSYLSGQPPQQTCTSAARHTYHSSNHMPLGETECSPTCPRREESANLTYDVNVDNVDSHQMAYADLPPVPHIRTRSLGYGHVVAGWSDRYYLPRVFAYWTR
jgi:hypothetical protein